MFQDSRKKRPGENRPLLVAVGAGGRLCRQLSSSAEVFHKLEHLCGAVAVGQMGQEGIHNAADAVQNRQVTNQTAGGGSFTCPPGAPGQARRSIPQERPESRGQKPPEGPSPVPTGRRVPGERRRPPPPSAWICQGRQQCRVRGLHLSAGLPEGRTADYPSHEGGGICPGFSF